MREQLVQYVDLLFAGAQDCEDIKQEILQNTLDRYDDLIAEGKVPEAAYRLAITGIGDVNEILGTETQTARVSVPATLKQESDDTPAKKLMRAIAVALYILCPIPVIVLSNLGMGILGVCGLLAFVAVATVLIILGDTKDEDEDEDEEENESLMTPKQKLRKSIDSLIGTVTVVLYFVISFATGAWGITWVLFLISGAVKGLVSAILDLKEASKHEN